jgi:hypothetical protein
MNRLMAASSDWTAKVEVVDEFRNLRAACRHFARHQYGIGGKCGTGKSERRS